MELQKKRTSKRGLVIGSIIAIGLIASLTNNHPSAPQQSTSAKNESTSQNIPVNEPTVLQAQEATPAAPPTTQAAPVPTATPAQKLSCDGDHYINAAGNCVTRPTTAPSAPAGATARCVDGTYSFSQSRRGTCSHHGGVAAWL